MNLNKFHNVVILIYCIFNIAGFALILEDNQLIGDFSNTPFNSQNINNLLLCLILVCISYVGVLKYIDRSFNIEKKHFANVKFINSIGLLIAVLQVLFFIWFYLTGTRSAASVQTDGSIYAIFFAIFEPDLFFVIYYMTFRGDKFVKANLLIYIISNLVRGWTGFIYLVLYMEIYYYLINNKLSIKQYLMSFLSLVIVVVVFPFMLIFKLFLREGLSDGYSISYFWYSIVRTVDGFNGVSVNDVFINYLINPVVGRFQVVASAFGIQEYVNEINDAFDQTLIFPYWAEGIHGVIWNRLFGNVRTEVMPLELGKLISSNSELLLGWTPNPSLIGWLFISGVEFPVFLLFIFFNIYVAVKLTQKLSPTPNGKNMVWFVALTLLMPGWLMSFNKFIFALLILNLIKVFYVQKKNNSI